MVYTFSISHGDMAVYEKIGLNPETILREADIPPRAVENVKFVLTRKQYVGLYEAIAKQIGDEKILAISTLDAKPAFVPATFAGLCAENGLNCIQRISKYKKLIAPYEMVVKEDAETVTIYYEFEDGGQLPHFTVLYEQINLLSILRRGSNDELLKPVEIAVTHQCPKNIELYYGLRITKANVNKMVFKKSDLRKPFVTENNNMWDYLEKELNQRLNELEIDNSFSGAVRKALIELLPSGVSDIEKISFELGVSKRTLQRRLNDENTTFNQQLNHVRELMVRNYLKMNMTLDEIAFLVNYVDSKSLSRAFRVWTGQSISEYKLAL